MIKRTIEVEYWIRRDTGEISFEYKDLVKDGEAYFTPEITDGYRTFHIFKNNGQVSKTDCSMYDIINRKAEELLQHQLQVEADCEADMIKAIKLKKIVDSAFKPGDERTEWYDTLYNDDFEDSKIQGFVTIKIKTSHSKWYQQDIPNVPSIYLTMVPKSVEKEARELQAIRQKHQEDPNFDFHATDYKKKIVRVADHENGEWN